MKKKKGEQNRTNDDSSTDLTVFSRDLPSLLKWNQAVPKGLTPFFLTPSVFFLKSDLQ